MGLSRRYNEGTEIGLVIEKSCQRPAQLLVSRNS
jgi:hypothetical protein